MHHQKFNTPLNLCKLTHFLLPLSLGCTPTPTGPQDVLFWQPLGKLTAWGLSCLLNDMQSFRDLPTDY